MKLVDTKDAVGTVLCHDITQIIKGVTKDARFRKGHVVKEEDIPVLLSLGKDHLYVWEAGDDMLHENDAARILCDLCKNEGMKESEVKEGKIELSAEYDGLLKIDKEKLFTVNSFGQMMIATRSGNTPVKAGDKLAGTRIIPLVIEKDKMQEVKDRVGDTPILSLLPYKKKKAVILATGNEVYYHRIEDTFTPVVAEKIKEYGAEVTSTKQLPDDNELLTKTILEAIENGAEMVLCTGGMSVDPDDKTPLAIKNTGADIISYGAPVLPGAMFLLAYYKKGDQIIPIMGLPGCVMYSKRTVFDLILPRIMADDKVSAEELAHLPKHFDFRVRVFMEEPDFGKGVAQLLSLTREKGSLSAAYKSMGMAASKAWKILNRAEADLGVKLVERKSGGKQGGGSHLTPEGEDILNRYENFQKEVAEAVKHSFIKNFGNSGES